MFVDTYNGTYRYCALFLVVIHYNGWALTTSTAYLLFAGHLVFVIWSIVSFYAL